VRCKPEGIDELSRVTKFSRKELQIMYRGFKQVGVCILGLLRFCEVTRFSTAKHDLASLRLGGGRGPLGTLNKEALTRGCTDHLNTKNSKTTNQSNGRHLIERIPPSR